MTRVVAPTASAAILWILLGAGSAAHAAGGVPGPLGLPDGQWEHLPAHAVIEAFGAAAALVVAWLLVSLERRKGGTSFNLQIAAALVGMGMVDGLHAVGSASDALATLVGGALFALVWLPRPWLENAHRWPAKILGAVAVLPGTVLIGVALACSQLSDGRWMLPEAVASGVGAALLLAAAARLGWSAWRTGHRADLSFGVVAALFASAGILSEFARPWDATWGAHLLRLAAYLVALAFAVVSDLRAQARTLRLADELRHLNSTLEERVSAHTAELEVALDLAQGASRAKSEFLANMSHEIRTPLNGVIGLTEVVLGTELTEFQRDHLHTVLDSGESLLKVINDVLDFSKIEAGKLEMEHVPFHLEDVVCDTLKALALRAQRKGLELSCLIDPDVPRVVIGDPGRLRQVITNLAGNAVTYTERGEVFVRVSLAATDAPMLHFTVLDSGVGIDPQQLGRVFESFEQADTSSTRRFGGTGLGLTISRELVERMGGQIRAESELGMGSAFSFTIQCEVPPGAPDARALLGSLNSTLEGQRVLIVDDNVTNRTILDAIARTKQMRPVLAASAEEALDLLERARQRQDPIPIVVSDVHMPDIDGFGLAERIRANRAFKDVGIIFLTSAVEDADRPRCEKLRVASRLMKPVKQSELLEVIARTLTDPRRGRASASSGAAPVPAAQRSKQELRTARREYERPPPLSRQRILLVEDSVANRKLALAILNDQGHAISVAENGRHAVEACEIEEFDVVLMDIQMPEMDGFQATAAIRKAEAASGRHVPIIAMTAHALQGDREKCLAAGMDDYIAKPIRRDNLFAALARAVGTPRTVVDWSGALAQVDGNREVLRGIVEAFVGEIRENLQLLPQAIAADAWPEVRRHAHTVKSAMRMFGATEAQDLAQKLESQAAAQDLTASSGLFERLESAVELVLPELAWFVETGRMDTGHLGQR